MPIYYGWKAGAATVVRPVTVSTTKTVHKLTRVEAPSGLIVMWSGPFADIPSGWVLCNGQNGTPDLRDRFILGASKKTGEVGGSHSRKLTEENTPSHDHAIGGSTKEQITDHQHDISNHEHSYTRLVPEDTQRKKGVIGSEPLTVYEPETEQTSPRELTCEAAKARHKHGLPTTTSATGDGKAFDIRPAYFKLAFIMKV